MTCIVQGILSIYAGCIATTIRLVSGRRDKSESYSSYAIVKSTSEFVRISKYYRSMQCSVGNALVSICHEPNVRVEAVET